MEGEPIRINGDGNQSRGFTYVDDIARGTIAALKPLGYEVINLGGHEVISINELVKLVEDLTGKKASCSVWPAQPCGYVYQSGRCEQGSRYAGLESTSHFARGDRQPDRVV
jgi:UDP-glucuronate 4-epimerase